MKKTTVIKVLAMLLTAAMMLSLLAGCGDKNNGGSGNANSGDNSGNKTDIPEYVYVPKYMNIKTGENMDGMYNINYSDGKLFFMGNTYSSIDPDGNELDESDEEYWTYYTWESGLYTLDIDTQEITKLDAYATPQLPEGMQGNINVSSMQIAEDGSVWVLENGYFYHYDVPEDFDPETDDEWNYYVDDGEQYYLRQLNPDGSEAKNIDISAMVNEAKGSTDDEYSYFYINYMQVDAAGNIYLATETEIYVLDSEGNVSFKLSVDNWINNIIRFGDGTVAALCYEDDGIALKPINVSAKAWDEAVELDGQYYYNMYQGSGEYAFYTNDGNNLCGVKASTGESEKIVNWIDSDINSNNLNGVVPLPDGRILCITYDWSRGTNNMELVMLTKTPSSEVPQKTVLTMASMYLGYDTRAMIVDFNKTNSDYRISVTDYSQFNTEDNYEAGLTKLITEITSGQMPDILDTNGISVTQYARKGILEDLYPYINEDPELGPDALVKGVCRALEVNGGLYQAISSFSISTVIGAENVVGDKMGWTFDEFNQCIKNMPEGCSVFSKSMTRDSILYYFCQMGIDNYVDWSTGECRFDSDDFVNVLELAKSFPETYDWESEYDGDMYIYESDYAKMKSGKQLLSITYLYDFVEFRSADVMLDGVTFKGFPTDGGSGSLMEMYGGVAMSASSANKDGVWQFIRTYLTEEFQTNDNGYVYGFPTNQKAFDKMLANAMEKQMDKDENGVSVEIPYTSWWVDDNTQIDIYAMTQEQADKIVALVDSLDATSENYDTSIMEIIQDEAAGFFAGQKSARDAASMIQSRVRIYVSEQM